MYLFINRLLPQTQKGEEDMAGYFGLGFCGNLQHKLWNLVENPNSSHAAKVRIYAFITFLDKMKCIGKLDTTR